MRSILNTTLSIGVVNVPVKVFSATASHDLVLHQYHEADAGRIRYEKVCEIEDQPVPAEEIVKGIETETGLVVLEDADFDRLPVTSKIIEVLAFVPAEQIDPVYYEKSYYLGPGDGGPKPFILIREALAEAGRVALARFTMRQRASLAAIRPYQGTLVLDTLVWADEVRIPEIEAPGEVVEAELEMAAMLIDARSGDWDPGKYTVDDYQEALAELIEAKQAGRAAPKARKERTATVTSLLDALEKSVAQTGAKPPSPKKAARKRAAKKSTAKRTARTTTAAAASRKKTTTAKAAKTTRKRA
ncbi:Ku protein [Glycomyces sp. NPDC047369]